MADFATHLYAGNAAAHQLWEVTLRELADLDRATAWRASTPSASSASSSPSSSTRCRTRCARRTSRCCTIRRSRRSKGPYPIFDNVTAIFSATPVITRTATYLYACTEWIDDAFQGKELLHEIYSRLLNPTSICLANHIVDLEAGPLARRILRLELQLRHGRDRRDAGAPGRLPATSCSSSRNIYGGAHQLLHDWYAKRGNLDVAVEWFDGFTADDFEPRAAARPARSTRDRLVAGPPHLRLPRVALQPARLRARRAGDLPRRARVRARGDLRRDRRHAVPAAGAAAQRPDGAARLRHPLLHQGPVGTGTTTAGVCIARNERMFIPKGDSVDDDRRPTASRASIDWDETLFWNVYYVKGAFLDADKAFEVINGMRTLELRMLHKCINTLVLARALAAPSRDQRAAARRSKATRIRAARAPAVPRPAGAALHDRLRHRDGPQDFDGTRSSASSTASSPRSACRSASAR